MENMKKWESLSKRLISSSKNTLKANKTLRNPDGTHRKKGAQTHAITYEDVLEILIQQDFKDCYTGLPFEPDYGKKGAALYEAYHPLAPSLDRLDNELGYIKGNIQLTFRFINLGFSAYKGDKYHILETLGVRCI